MKKIKISIVGIGNCASAIVQGVNYYKNRKADDFTEEKKRFDNQKRNLDL